MEIEVKPLSMTEAEVLFACVRMSTPDGEGNRMAPSMSDLVEGSKWGMTTLYRHLAILRKKGYLGKGVVRGRNNTTVGQILCDKPVSVGKSAGRQAKVWTAGERDPTPREKQVLKEYVKQTSTHGAVSMSDIARKLDVSRQRVHQIVTTLTQLGYIQEPEPVVRVAAEAEA